MNSWATRFLIYSLVGAVIKEFQGNKRAKKATMNLPDFKGVLEVKHALPGRIRFYIPTIKDDGEKIDYLLNNFNRIGGFKHIEVNPVLGTVLIKYDESIMKPVLIIGIILKLLSLEEEVQREPQSLLTKEVKNLGEALNYAVYNKTKGIVDMRNLMMLSLLILGIHKIRTNPGVPISGVTSFWWAYSFIRIRE